MDQGGGTVVKQMSVIHDQDQAARPGSLRDSLAGLANSPSSSGCRSSLAGEGGEGPERNGRRRLVRDHVGGGGVPQLGARPGGLGRQSALAHTRRAGQHERTGPWAGYA